MNHYELMVIYSPNLNEDEQRQQFSQIEELLKHENANLYWVDRWGKRKLAYPVKKHRQGFYDWLYFELDPSRISEIDRKLKMSEVILRFMILKMEKIQVQNLQREIDRKSQAAQAQSESASVAASASDNSATEASQQQEEPVAEAQQEPETAGESSPEKEQEA